MGVGWADSVAVWEGDGEGDGDGEGALGNAVSGGAVAELGDVLGVGVGCVSVADAGPASGPAISDSAKTSGPALLTKRRLG